MGIKLLLIVCFGVVAADYGRDGGFLPSTTYQRTEDQLAEPSSRVEKMRDERDSQADRTQRFGVTGYGSTGTYGGTAPGLYSPLKIDLGGVLLGSILGFGAVIILPKIIHAFSYSYGGYGRSAESDQISDVISRLDETLSRYNVDTGSCAQRLACSYVQLADENMISGNATEFDALLSSVTSNSLIRRMLDGTSIYQAMAAGKSADTDCQRIYPKCKLDKKTVVKIITQMLPS